MADPTREQLGVLHHSGEMLAMCAHSLLAHPDSLHVESWRNQIALHAQRIAEICVLREPKPPPNPDGMTPDLLTNDSVRGLMASAACAGDVRVATDCEAWLKGTGGRAFRSLIAERVASAYNRYRELAVKP